jgi:hypothetical protein
MLNASRATAIGLINGIIDNRAKALFSAYQVMDG